MSVLQTALLMKTPKTIVVLFLKFVKLNLNNNFNCVG